MKFQREAAAKRLAQFLQPRAQSCHLQARRRSRRTPRFMASQLNNDESVLTTTEPISTACK
jgi:hypothetical protein